MVTGWVRRYPGSVPSSATRCERCIFSKNEAIARAS
jgi:hypothetical protein